MGDKLDRIVAGTDELQQVFEALKLKDEASYEQLTGIVRAAADRNESIGQVVDRLQVIGQVGRRLAEKVAGLTPADLLRVLARGGRRVGSIAVGGSPACWDGGIWVQRRGDEPWDDEGIERRCPRRRRISRWSGCSMECSRAGPLAVTVALRWDGVMEWRDAKCRADTSRQRHASPPLFSGLVGEASTEAAIHPTRYPPGSRGITGRPSCLPR